MKQQLNLETASVLARLWILLCVPYATCALFVGVIFQITPNIIGDVDWFNIIGEFLTHNAIWIVSTCALVDTICRAVLEHKRDKAEEAAS